MTRLATASLLVNCALVLLAVVVLAVAIGPSDTRTRDALPRVETPFSTIIKAEQRGYLLSGDQADLEPHRLASRDIKATVAAVGADDRRGRHLAAMAPPAQAWPEETQRTVTLRQAGEAEAALEAVFGGEGRRAPGKLRAEVVALRRFIRREEGQGQRQGVRATAVAVLSFAAGALASLLLGLLVLVVRRRLRRREPGSGIPLPEEPDAEFERISSAVLLDALPVGVLLADAAGRIVRSNAELARIWGGPVPVASGTEGGLWAEARWLDSGAPLAPQDWAIARALRTGETSVGEMIRLHGADGCERVIVKSAAPVRDGHGRLLGAVAIMQDVSDRQLDQDRRLEAEAQYRAIVETAADAIVTIDEQGRVRSANPAVAQLFGHAPEAVVGRDVALLMPARIAAVHDGVVARYTAAGAPRVAWSGREVTARHKDGSEFPVELSLARWRAGDGSWRFTGLMRDISERRRAERALQESDRRLREMQVEFLHVARLTEMGLMAATLADELNQPLTAAAAYIGGARRMMDRMEGSPLAAFRDAMALAMRQMVEAGQIVRRMRGFVAQEAGRDAEDLATLVSGAAELVTFPARQQNVELRLALDAATPQVNVDRTQIRQMLVSLMHNAIEAMEGSARRRLTIRTFPQGPDTAQITVLDTGSGIAPEVAGDLFRPFVTTKRSGLGVGLSVCRTIVEGHGGRIWAEPNPEGGTAFHVTLPALPRPD